MAYILEKCNKCPHLVKQWISEDHLGYDAACSKITENMNGKTLIKVIRKHVGDMLGIETPNWCPMMHNGVDTLKKEDNIIKDEKPKTLSEMSYQEKRDCLKVMKPHLSWDDFKVGKKYIIPKWDRYSSAKEIMVAEKHDDTIKYHELDEFGNEKNGLLFLRQTEEKIPIIVESHNF